jgi:hypothetical protein
VPKLRRVKIPQSRAVQTALAAIALALPAACGEKSRDVATVPDVRGLELEAAQHVLLEAGLVHERLRCPNVPDPAVVAQRPAPGTDVAVGTPVALRMEPVHASGVEAPAGGWPSCESAGFR